MKLNLPNLLNLCGVIGGLQQVEALIIVQKHRIELFDLSHATYRSLKSLAYV